MKIRLFFYLLCLPAIIPIILFAGSIRLEPELKESLALDGYRRVWGNIRGSFYFQRRNNIEIRNYLANNSFLKKLRKRQKLVPSELGNFYALVDYKSLSPSTLKVTQIRLFDKTGKLLWNKKNPGCHSFILSDTEPAVVGLDGAEGLPQSRLLFFGTGGQLLATTRLPHLIGSGFSGDGRYFFAASAVEGLKKFTRDGREIRSYENCEQFRVNHTGNAVAIINSNHMRIYLSDSLVMSKELEVANFRDLQFMNNGRQAALLTAKNFEFLDLKLGRTVGSFRLLDSTMIFFHFDTDLQGNYFLCSGSNAGDKPEERNTHGEVLLLDREMNLLWKKSLSYSRWSIKYPDVSIDSKQRLLVVRTAEKLEVYSF